MSSHNQLDCFVCRKHRGEIAVPGGAIFEDDLIFIGHAQIPDGETAVYLGWVLIEPKRHVPGFAELTEKEAQTVGVWISRMSQALKNSQGAEHVYIFVLGHHVDHLHVHLVPRYPDTPREYWGMRIDEWPEAPKGDSITVTALVTHLQNNLV